MDTINPPINVDNIIAITWAPRTVPGDPISQMKIFLPTVKKLKECCTTFQIYPELTVNGSIHFHGTLMISDKIKWFKKMLPTLKNRGFVLIKKEPNQGWTSYMMKDAEMMEQILEMKLPLHRLHQLLQSVKLKKPPCETSKIILGDIEKQMADYSDASYD